VLLDSKLLFHHHLIIFFLSRSKRLVLYLRFFYHGQSIVVICQLVRSTLQYASPVWNSIATADANQMKAIQLRVSKLFFPQVNFNYAYALEILKLHTSQDRRQHTDAFFFFKFVFFKN
jgi:hypothetical protein